MRYSVFYDGEVLCDKEPLFPMSDAINNIYDVCGDIMKDSVCGRNLTDIAKGDTFSSRGIDREYFTGVNMKCDIQYALSYMKEDIWGILYLRIYPDDHPVMPLYVSLRCKEKPFKYCLDGVVIKDSVDDVKDTYNTYFYTDPEKDPYPDVELMLELRDKNFKLISTKYKSSNEWVDEDDRETD